MIWVRVTGFALPSTHPLEGSALTQGTLRARLAGALHARCDVLLLG